MAKYHHAENWENPQRKSWEKCVSDGQRQTGGQTNRTDFLGPLPQKWKFDHVFQKFEDKIYLNYFSLILSHIEIINTRQKIITNINKIVFAISNRKIKTSKLLLIKYIKITKLFTVWSNDQVCTNFRISILYYSTNR